MPIRSRQQTLIVAALLGATFLLGDKLVMTPLTRSWTVRSARITELTKQVNRGSLLLERERAIQDRWDQMRTNTLPESVSAAENELLHAFERWSQESRMSISSIKPQSKRTSDDFMTLECRADAFGSLQALSHFLYEAENDPMALRIEAVEISSRDNSGQQMGLGLLVSGLQLVPETE